MVRDPSCAAVMLLASDESTVVHRPRQLLGRQREREVARPAAGGSTRRARRGPGGARRAGRGQDRAARLRGRRGARVSGRPDRRRRRGDGAPVRGASAVVRTDPRADGAPARAPARRACRGASGSAPGRLRIRSSSGSRSSACCRRRPRSEPLLCVVDDAQWLDRASAARARVRGAPPAWRSRIALVFATRERGDALAGFPELRVEPLGRRDARSLLESVLPAPLDEHVLDRIVLETHGNPLALLELPRGLTPAQLAGGFGLPAAVPLSASIEESFARRLARLPADARRLLLIAAADPTGDPALVWRAARTARNPRVEPRETVEADGLVELGARVVFRHPLVRSAVYRAAEPDERRAVHRALADATDPEIDPDRRAWHRAQAASMPDEDVAAELERSAATGAGARRIGGRRCLPRARGGADARARATAPQRAARGCRRQARRRRSGGCARAVGRARGRRAGRARARPGRPSAGRIALEQRRGERRRPPVSQRGEAPRAARPRAGPRDLPRGARGRDVPATSRSSAARGGRGRGAGGASPAPPAADGRRRCSTRSRSA